MMPKTQSPLRIESTYQPSYYRRPDKERSFYTPKPVELCIAEPRRVRANAAAIARILPIASAIAPYMQKEPNLQRVDARVLAQDMLQTPGYHLAYDGELPTTSAISHSDHLHSRQGVYLGAPTSVLAFSKIRKMDPTLSERRAGVPTEYVISQFGIATLMDVLDSANTRPGVVKRYLGACAGLMTTTLEGVEGPVYLSGYPDDTRSDKFFTEYCGFELADGDNGPAWGSDNATLVADAGEVRSRLALSPEFSFLSQPSQG